jgi:outer membrane protein
MKADKMRILVFIILSIFCATTVESQEEDGSKLLTLTDSVLKALDRNWTLKAKKEKVNEATAVKRQAYADFFPKFSTAYSYTRLDREETTGPIDLGIITLPGSTRSLEDNYQWKTTISQPVFTGFALLSAYELGKLGIDGAELEIEQEKLDLALRVKEAYFGVLEADRGVQVAEQAVESLKSHVKVAKSFYDVGMIPVNDLLEAEVELANAEHDLIKAQNASRIARALFNTVLARPIETPVALKDVEDYQQETKSLSDYMATALDERPEIKLLNVNLKQTEQNRRIARSDYYPDISLQYDYIKEGDEPYLQGSDVHDGNRWQVMGVLSWTFFEWGKTRSAVREVDSKHLQLIQTRAALEDQIRFETKQAYLDLSEAEKNIPTTAKAVDQAEENLRVNRERYQAQVATSTDVLDAQTLLTRARTNYYRALYSHHLARARLERALGTY